MKCEHTKEKEKPWALLTGQICSPPHAFCQREAYIWITQVTWWIFYLTKRVKVMISKLSWCGPFKLHGRKYALSPWHLRNLSAFQQSIGNVRSAFVDFPSSLFYLLLTFAALFATFIFLSLTGCFFHCWPGFENIASPVSWSLYPSWNFHWPLLIFDVLHACS